MVGVITKTNIVQQIGRSCASAVDFVEHTVGAAMRALALPATITAVQHRRKTTAVEEQHGLLATGDALSDSGQQWRRKHGFLGLMLHVDGDDFGQHATANALGHRQPKVTSASTITPHTAVVPAFKRRRCRTGTG